MDRIRYESRSLAAALLSYLNARGWNLDKIHEEYLVDEPLTLPAVSIHFMQTREHERQMGRDAKAFKRPIQIDAYMENKQRATGITDTIGDFMDEITVSVTDPLNGEALLAYMTCFDTESIVLDTLPPIYTDSAIKRWRGVAKCTYDIDYLNSFD